jgi:hypothetical protein
MTESINTTSPAGDDDDLFEESSDEFIGKPDFKDRLVMIYPTGKSGERIGENGKPYPWYETYTVVLDDGPNGYQEQVLDADLNGGQMRPNRIPSVEINGAQIIEDHQWSAGGVTSRLKDKVPAKHDGVPVGLLGRIDAKAQKGKAAAWRPNAPTEADRARAVEPAIKAARLKARDAIVASLKAAGAEDAF